jgi:hypothetical protein
LDQTTIRNLEEIPPFRFRLSLDTNDSWINVFLPLRYPIVQPECYFSSDNVNRQTWTEINFEIDMKIKELNINNGKFPKFSSKNYIFFFKKKKNIYIN